MRTQSIRVAILDDHQSIVDGYRYRLSQRPEIEIEASIHFGQDLEPILAKHPVDVLLLDVKVPISPDNDNPYPILHLIPKLLQRYPGLSILVISMYHQPTLIKAVMEAGASGYVLKDDIQTIQQLGEVVIAIAGGGIHLSQQAYQQLAKKLPRELALSPRQREVLSLCGAHPDVTTEALARNLDIAQSTVRNLLSDAYLRLGVRSRAGAIVKARELGLITPIDELPTP